MPFKSGKSPEDVAKDLTKSIDNIAGDKLQLALTKTANAIGGAADFYTPIDTGDLMQSRRIVVNKSENGQKAAIRYGFDHTGSYAVKLHEFGNWTPAKPGSPSKRGSGLNPNATSHWLIKGEAEVDSKAMLKRLMTI